MQSCCGRKRASLRGVYLEEFILNERSFVLKIDMEFLISADCLWARVLCEGGDRSWQVLNVLCRGRRVCGHRGCIDSLN